MKTIINYILLKWGLEMVPTSILSNLRKTNEMLVKRTLEERKVLTGLEEQLGDVHRLLDSKIAVIEANKFLPSTKPNLELAVDTVIGWGSQNEGKTTASFLKKLCKKLGDSHIESLNRYVKTEVTKRKLTEKIS